MKVKVIVFDLDDTLYNEIDFVKSGFNEVAKFFATKYKIDKELLFNKMLQILEEKGRGRVFDEALKYFNIFNKTNVKKSISIYRTHKPNISITPEAKDILEFFYGKKIPLYLVTDGNKIVQNNKVVSLNINKYFKKVFITHRYGIKHSKPSPYCFNKIAQLENVDNRFILYIGDNINKDFVTIKKLGFQTIRLKNGMFINTVKDKAFHAKIDIDSLNELKTIIKL